jgi:hypothetical protein
VKGLSITSQPTLGVIIQHVPSPRTTLICMNNSRTLGQSGVRERGDGAGPLSAAGYGEDNVFGFRHVSFRHQETVCLSLPKSNS